MIFTPVVHFYYYLLLSYNHLKNDLLIACFNRPVKQKFLLVNILGISTNKLNFYFRSK